MGGVEIELKGLKNFMVNETFITLDLLSLAVYRVTNICWPVGQSRDRLDLLVGKETNSSDGQQGSQMLMRKVAVTTCTSLKLFQSVPKNDICETLYFSIRQSKGK